MRSTSTRETVGYSHARGGARSRSDVIVSCCHCFFFLFFFFFFFNDTAPTEIYPLPLHAALPIASASRSLVPTYFAGRRTRYAFHTITAPSTNHNQASAICRCHETTDRARKNTTYPARSRRALASAWLKVSSAVATAPNCDMELRGAA